MKPVGGCHHFLPSYPRAGFSIQSPEGQTRLGKPDELANVLSVQRRSTIHFLRTISTYLRHLNVTLMKYKYTFGLLCFVAVNSVTYAENEIRNAAYVFDECLKVGQFSKDHCRSLANSSNFGDCFEKCRTASSCFSDCASKDHPEYPPNSDVRAKIAKKKLAKATTKADIASRFVGLTETDLVKEFGKPKEIKEDDSPDGPFRMLDFSQSPDRATAFFILKSEGVVSSGFFEGILFEDPGMELASKRCKEEWPNNISEQLSCSDEYRTPRRNPR